MTSSSDHVFPLQSEGLQVTGLFKKRNPTVTPRSLVVFIHGGGANAAYFDNPGFRYVHVAEFEGLRLAKSRQIPRSLK